MTVAAFEAGSEEIEVTVTYDGPAVADGRMSARDLGVAMTAMSALLEQAAGVVYGSGAALRVEIRADFKKGSFSFDLVAAPEAVRAALEFARDVGITAAGVDLVLRLLGFKIGDGGGLIGLVRWLRNRRVTKVERAATSTTVHVADGGTLVVNNNVFNLAANSNVRAQLSKVLVPLDADGVDELRTSDRGAVQVSIAKEERRFFEAPPPPEVQVQDTTSTEFVEVVAPSFRDGNKWKFSQGKTVFHATVQDRAFLEKVDRHQVSFGKGDALEVSIRRQVSHTPDGLKATFEIERVIRHIPAPVQTDMFGG